MNENNHSMAIVVIGYNKKDGLCRLLKSLNDADYRGELVTLIISIDKSDTEEVVDLAKSFVWKHGNKRVRTFEERQGLRKHVLSCGDFLDEFDAIFIFEDDIMVSPQFYKFGRLSVEHYYNNPSIAGISLYSPSWHYDANFPFEPQKDIFDTYFMEYAQSWGQIWMKNQWKAFREWYNDNIDFFKTEQQEDIPLNLYTWGDNSWLKYHIAYCICNHKSFVYPYYSFSTTFSQKGTHIGSDLTRFQSNMMIRDISHYQFAEFNQDAIRYDGFFENINVKEYLQNKWNAYVIMDLYGRHRKYDKDALVLSTQVLPYEIKHQYALQLRPIEHNALLDIDGEGIYLYDAKMGRECSKKEKTQQLLQVWNYFMKERFMTWKEIIPVSKQKMKNVIQTLFLK